MFGKNLTSYVRHLFSSLTRTEAEIRASFIKKNTIDYNCHLTLHKGQRYEGLTKISFEANDTTLPQSELSLDFQGKSIKSLLINGQSLSQPEQYLREGAIRLPQRYLQIGKNRVVIQYSNDYDQDGNGCVSFIDVDGKQYLYTQFEPYFASRVFPLFDQPDLKAPFSLQLATPSDWDAVLSNEFTKPSLSVASIAQEVLVKWGQIQADLVGKYEAEVPKDFKQTQFITTKLLPSYLYCFVVGPYKELAINLSRQGKPGYVPMKLYSIESLYPQMVALAPFIEEITVRSMDFFQKYFGYAYPFSKYDQVFAHEYKWGAMENAGLVTLNDLYLFKDKVSEEKLLSFGNTVVHELAHHWFGNLVTMKWWDDLWLNESFAEYISHYCLQNIRPELKTIAFESAMVSFLNRKAWGYAEDELATTHPIRGEVEDTSTAESIFDGITYSKGAATMKQLMYLLGQDKFSKALAHYFHKFEFSNAVLDDLLNSLSPYFASLPQWKKQWLETAGTNVLSLKWKAGDSSVIINQRPDRSDCPTLRTHRIKIAFIKKDHSIIVRDALVEPIESTEIKIDIPTETIAALLNYDDLTFAKIELDQTSRSYFEENLSSVKCVLSRALVWKAQFGMLKDCVITSSQFVNFALKNLSKQASDPIFEEQINHLYSAVTQYTPFRHRQLLYNSIYSFLTSLLLNLGEHHNNRQVILRDKLIDFVQSDSQREELRLWYQGEGPLKSQPLNNTLRWKIVVKLFGGKTLSNEQKWALFSDMQAKDSSDTMINKRFTCQALAANITEYETLYDSLFKREGLSLTNTVNRMRGMNSPIHQSLLKQKYYAKYFADAKRYLAEQVNSDEEWFIKGDYLENFVVHMDPHCEGTADELLQKAADFKKLNVKSSDKIRRTILKKIEQLERRARAYQYFETQQKA